MRVYTLTRKQELPISLAEAWRFFATPENLARITPPYMRFKIEHISEAERMYAGQIISYKLFVLPYVPVRWTTEITHAKEQEYFVDEQRSGPYALWHHQHHFKETPGGVLMIDEVNYAIPLGILGRLAHWLFVQRQLNAIFEFRFKTLETIFAAKTVIRKSA